MKRELKDAITIQHYETDERGCSPNPYEEGTESFVAFDVLFVAFRAAAQIPMKRELKGCS